jgi:hypothetical protein
MSITKDQILEVLKMAVENSRRWYELGDSQMMPHWGLINTRPSNSKSSLRPGEMTRSGKFGRLVSGKNAGRMGLTSTGVRPRPGYAEPPRRNTRPIQFGRVRTPIGWKASMSLWPRPTSGATKSLMIKRDDKGKVIDLIDDEENTMFSWEPGPSNASGWMMSLLRPMRAGANPVSSKPGDYIRPSNLQ